MMFLDCPEYLDRHGTVRCGLPAEVEHWYTARSSDGPLESAKIRCPRGHWFNGPLDSLILPSTQAQAGPRAQAGPPGRASLLTLPGATGGAPGASERGPIPAPAQPENR